MDDGKKGREMDRRGFLKISTLSGAVALAGLSVTGREAQAAPKKWDRHVDVVVVGTGYSGLAAAIEAHDAGSSVVIIEKMPVIGGNSVLAGGGLNAVDPKRQAAQGIKDSVDLHFEQTISGGDFRADPVKVRYMAEHALEAWDWLETMGCELFGGKVFQIYGSLWPRPHRAIYKDAKNGAAIIAAMNDQVKKRRIPVLMEHKVTNIYREKPLEGRVLGLEVEGKGKKLQLKARKGVVLASGGFCADVEMRMRHDPRWTQKFGTTNQEGATGETLNMAEDIGADVIGLDYIQSIGPTGPDVRYVKEKAGFAPLFDNPMYMMGKLKVSHSIYTDLRGKRIVAADARRDAITEASMRTPERVCVGIFDAVAREANNRPPDQVFPEKQFQEMMRRHPKEMFAADTLRELAQKVGMPDPKVLEDTVARFNSFVDAKLDPDFGQNPINLVWKCEKPPFWAATGSPATHHMCGGLRTKGTSAIVLDRWNKPIPGFYAAGEITGGVHGANRLGGNGTSDCLVFGRLAGKEVAAQKPVA